MTQKKKTTEGEEERETGEEDLYRMCLNNWGGINHKILEFHEYVNLFSGKKAARENPQSWMRSR